MEQKPNLNPSNGEYLTSSNDPKSKKDSRYLNMDLVRYVMAFAVIVSHYNTLVKTDFYWPIESGPAVGGFFGLSGFLVYLSYLRRPSFKVYITSRARRILPVYCFVVIASALALSLVSNLSFDAYFTNGDFWKYLVSNLCFMNFIQPTLPGVFESFEIPNVNSSLWTIKVEWMLYLSIPLFFWAIKRFKWSVTKSVVVIFICSVFYRQFVLWLYERTGQEILVNLSRQFVGQLVYFYAGVLFYYQLPHIKQNKWMYVVGSVFLILVSKAVMNYLGDSNSWMVAVFDEVCFPIGLVFLILLISVAKSLGDWIAKLGNCSYEMYLFHFPIIQVVVYAGLPEKYSSFGVFLFTVVLIFALSFIVNRVVTKLMASKK